MVRATDAAAADAAARPEAVRAVDDDRVRRGNVEPDSTVVEQSRRLQRLVEVAHDAPSSRSGIWPCAIASCARTSAELFSLVAMVAMSLCK
jgi:hypothetical protein